MDGRHRREAGGADDGAPKAAAVDVRAVAIAEAVTAVADAIAVVACAVFASIAAVVVGVIFVAMFIWLSVRSWVACSPP